MKKTVEKWMRTDRGGPLRLILYALSLLYGAVVRARLFLYSTGIIKPERLGCKVVSVGNVTAGGSGKTPLTMHIAKLLKARGASVVVLSRGYRRQTTGTKVVSDGREVLLGVKEAGDEPLLMARRLKGIPVVIGEDRVLAGELIVKKFSPDCIILDDGFQHVRLARDLNILLVDARTGFGNGHLLPSGVLREPLRGIGRADLAMVKGGGGAEDILKARDADKLKRFGLDVIAFSYTAVTAVDLKSDEPCPPGSLKRKKAVAVAGLADPESFFDSLKSLGVSVVKRLPYPDHHDYTRADLEHIKKAAAGADIVLTTEKDGVKLARFARDLSRPLLAIAVEVYVSDPGLLEKHLAPFMPANKTEEPALS